MKLKPYPKYKDSGIQWIGEIPEGWGILPIRGICELGRGRVISNEEIGENEGAYPVYSSQTSNDGEMGKINTYDFNGEYVTWTTDGANAGTCFYRNGKFNCTNVCGTLKRKNKKIYMPLLPYILNLGTKYYVRKDINPKLMNNMMAAIKIGIPTHEVQICIASYLDKKTAKIDALIAKDKKLIALLKEKRTALINHAVTKGLDPNAKLKDSGIEWIGKIPEGWEVRKTKHLSINLDGKRIPISADMREEGDIPYYGATGILDYVKDYLFNEILLLVGEDGAPFFDKTKIVAYIIKGKSWVNNHAHVLRVNKNVEISWLCYCLNAIDYSRYIKGTTRDKLNQDELNNIIVITPPLPDQTAIANFLDKATAKIDKTIKLIEKKIKLLEEYKKSLIHYVVTGKVDVREAVV